MAPSKFNTNTGVRDKTPDETLIVVYILVPVLLLVVIPCLIIGCHICCNVKSTTSFVIIRFLKWLYNCCCCRPDCITNLDLDEAISRHREEEPFDKSRFVDELTGNPAMVSILSTINKENPDYFFSVLPSGSLREGFGKMVPSTSPLATDYDVMLVPDSVLTGDRDVQYEGNETPIFSITENRDIKPGYMWLRLENDYLKQWDKLCIRRQTEGIGCSYLSSFKIQNLIKSTLTSNDSDKVELELKGDNVKFKLSVEHSGPAITIKFKKTDESSINTVCKNSLPCFSCPCLYPPLAADRIFFYCDFTPALYCPKWPRKAEGWFAHERRQNWPTQDVVDTIKMIGCHVVPKPSTKALVKLHEEQPICTTYGQSPGLEWRFSFSQPEILLAENIPNEARAAFLALKSIKNRILNKHLENGLSSYILKTVMFRTIEETQLTDMTQKPKASSDFFTLYIDKLAAALADGRLIHFWIDGINLLEDVDTQSMPCLIDRVNEVRMAPQRYVADNWLEISRCARLNCCHCRGNQPNVVDPIVTQPRDPNPCCLCFHCHASYSEDTTVCGPWPYDPVNYDVY